MVWTAVGSFTLDIKNIYFKSSLNGYFGNLKKYTLEKVKRKLGNF